MDAQASIEWITASGAIVAGQGGFSIKHLRSSIAACNELNNATANVLSTAYHWRLTDPFSAISCAKKPFEPYMNGFI